MPVTQTQSPGDPTFHQLQGLSGLPCLVVAFFSVPTTPALTPGFKSLQTIVVTF